MPTGGVEYSAHQSSAAIEYLGLCCFSPVDLVILNRNQLGFNLHCAFKPVSSHAHVSIHRMRSQADSALRGTRIHADVCARPE